MIKIDKSKQIPAILTGAKATNALQTVVEKAQAGTNPDSDDFDANVYNGPGVKSQLLTDQNQKCAFCEVSMSGDFGSVEHYRPKTGWKENKADSLHKPGYYWLAFDWTNFVCSCDKCNSAARKGNLFPLRNPANRDIALKNIAQEVPLIINPTTEDPGQYIRFRKYLAAPVMINDVESDKGRTTIDIFDLNGCITTATAPARTDLLNDRKEEWNKAKELYKILLSLGATMNEAIEKVKEVYAKPEDKFAGMFIHQDVWF